MRKTSFTLEILGEQEFEAYDHPHETKHKGWSIPFFTQMQACAVVEAWKQHDWRVGYDDFHSTFFFETAKHPVTGHVCPGGAFSVITYQEQEYYLLGITQEWEWREVGQPAGYPILRGL